MYCSHLSIHCMYCFHPVYVSIHGLVHKQCIDMHDNTCHVLIHVRCRVYTIYISIHNKQSYFVSIHTRPCSLCMYRYIHHLICIDTWHVLFPSCLCIDTWPSAKTMYRYMPIHVMYRYMWGAEFTPSMYRYIINKATMYRYILDLANYVCIDT